MLVGYLFSVPSAKVRKERRRTRELLEYSSKVLSNSGNERNTGGASVKTACRVSNGSSMPEWMLYIDGVYSGYWSEFLKGPLPVKYSIFRNK